MPLDFVSNTDEKVPVYVAPVRANGKPAKIEGKAVLSILSGGATVQPATDEQIAAEPTLVGYVVSEDNDGSSEWKVTADADLGAGVSEIAENGVYQYSSAPAVSMGASAGTPIAK